MYIRFEDNGAFIRCISNGDIVMDQFFCKKDIKEISPVAQRIFKIAFKNKAPQYFSTQFVSVPTDPTAIGCAQRLMGWITDKVCAGAYPPSEEPPPA
ncbi:MAG TPA: hypothetical protein VJ552_05820 [Sediminibacterium sp.]|nr:hypothetical protein [Sediminibacterium sp.]